MNAPEKIYICPSDLAGIDYDEEWLEFPWGDNSIEYTRTDAFIDKACKWLKFNYTEYLNDTRIGIDIDEMVKDFKMDMKGRCMPEEQQEESERLCDEQRHR